MTKKTALAFFILALCSQTITSAQDDFYDETVLRTLQLELSQPDWWSQLEANAQTDENIIAALTVDDVTCEGVGVRFRGMTSYSMTGNSQKKSFNIKIDFTDENQRLMGYKTLNLINCFDDPTFMREPLYSNIIRRQIPSAKANFVKLEINGENWGIYANVQQINAEFIEDWFPDNSGTCWRALGAFANFGQDPGDRQTPEPEPEPDDTPPPRTRQMAINELTPNEAGGGGGFGNGSAALTWQGSDLATYEAVYEIKNTKQDNPWDSLINTCDVLNNTPLEQLPDVIDEVLNVDRALWLCAFEIIFHDDDGYVSKRGSDYYLYYEPHTGQINVIQYDANTCMKWSNSGWSIFYGETDSQVPLMSRLMAIKQYRQRYLAHVRTILNSFLTEETLFPKIDAYRALIEEQVNLDDKKLYSNQAFASGIDQLKDFVRNRRNSILSNRLIYVPTPEIITVDRQVTQDDSGQSLTITASLGDAVPVIDVQLYFAAGSSERFTSVTMLDDGLHSDGLPLDGTFGYTLPTKYPMGTVLRYYVQATAGNGFDTLVFSPEGAEYNTYTHIVTYTPSDSTPVVINELMANNNSTITDPQDDYDDWIELANITSETVDLSGMYLSDNPENPLKWQFPEGTRIEPEGYLIVWADEDGGDEPGLHANFKLSSHGETIWLFDTDERSNSLLDSVTFGLLDPDISFGLYPDGSAVMQTLSTPTPLTPNAEP